ncbi:MAG: hypothetical protein JXR33_00820 [Coriobacteriia bacterium]|nr:hypothetical protein [Coriobacteriia bacterium]
MNDLLALPADRFPSIHQVIETGQVLRGYDEVIDFAVEAIIARVDDSLGH